MAISQRINGRPNEFELIGNGRPSTREILSHNEGDLTPDDDEDSLPPLHARPSRGGRKGPRPSRKNSSKAATTKVAATAPQAPTPVIGGSLLVDEQIAEGGE